ncbi:hypothetical protein TTRE_0000112101 [Trichuris trichiura]|uniref:Uncharacterized protein n=1 Tax=Trichuris trichiura TaxID=36087 RepID=A0A077YYP3_TRITR|nr:hypothetical protein TTRE_0000112101 [Trichuris trichiura]
MSRQSSHDITVQPCTVNRLACVLYTDFASTKYALQTKQQRGVRVQIWIRSIEFLALQIPTVPNIELDDRWTFDQDSGSGIALAGKALCIGSLCSLALAGGVVFGVCKLLGISKLDDLTKLKKGEFSFGQKDQFGSGRRIDTWQQLLDYINESDRTK